MEESSDDESQDVSQGQQDSGYTDEGVKNALHYVKQCPLIDLKDLEYDMDKEEDFLGGGGFGKVYKAGYKGTIVAFKIMEASYRFNKPQKSFILTCKEARKMSGIAHSSVLRLHGIVLDKSGINGLVLECMEHGSLRDLLNNGVVIPDCLKVEMMLDIANALKCLHSEGHVHADIKLGNILLNQRFQAKLGDFGVTLLHGVTSNITGKMSSMGRGSVQYMAPELFEPEIVGLLKITNTSQSDVWSFGVTLFELVKGETPLQGLQSEMAVIFKVVRHGLKNLCASELTGCDPKVLADVALSCVEFKPEDRITCKDIFTELHSDYINNHQMHRLEGVRQLYANLKLDESAFDEISSSFDRSELDSPVQQEVNPEVKEHSHGSSRVGKLVDRYPGMNLSGEQMSLESAPRSFSPETTQVSHDLTTDDVKALISGESYERSSSASGLSYNHSNSTEKLDQSVPSPQSMLFFLSRVLTDIDLDVEQVGPTLAEQLPREVLKKLKAKEKKRQEVINELFFSEKIHLRNLKVTYLLFYRPMMSYSYVSDNLVRTIFPNLEDVIQVHKSLNEDMKRRHKESPVVPQVADLLLRRVRPVIKSVIHSAIFFVYPHFSIRCHLDQFGAVV